MNTTTDNLILFDLTDPSTWPPSRVDVFTLTEGGSEPYEGIGQFEPPEGLDQMDEDDLYEAIIWTVDGEMDEGWDTSTKRWWTPLSGVSVDATEGATS